jgi:hypothetical protein
MQNMPKRQGYLAVSVQVTVTAQKLQTVVETLLGLTANSLATIYRTITIQVDPETSGGLSVRVGNGNVGTTVAGVVQKGMTLTGGSSYTDRSTMNACYFGMLWAQAVSGTPVLNIQLEEV